MKRIIHDNHGNGSVKDITNKRQKLGGIDIIQIPILVKVKKKLFLLLLFLLYYVVNTVEISSFLVEPQQTWIAKFKLLRFDLAGQN